MRQTKLVGFRAPKAWHEALTWLADNEHPQRSISATVSDLVEIHLRAQREKLPAELQRKLDQTRRPRRRDGFYQRSPVKLEYNEPDDSAQEARERLQLRPLPAGRDLRRDRVV